MAGKSKPPALRVVGDSAFLLSEGTFRLLIEFNKAESQLFFEKKVHSINQLRF
jgi:hypothetical protein